MPGPRHRVRPSGPDGIPAEGWARPRLVPSGRRVVRLAGCRADRVVNPLPDPVAGITRGRAGDPKEQLPRPGGSTASGQRGVRAARSMTETHSAAGITRSSTNYSSGRPPLKCVAVSTSAAELGNLFPAQACHRCAGSDTSTVIRTVRSRKESGSAGSSGDVVAPSHARGGARPASVRPTGRVKYPRGPVPSRAGSAPARTPNPPDHAPSSCEPPPISWIFARKSRDPTLRSPPQAVSVGRPRQGDPPEPPVSPPTGRFPDGLPPHHGGAALLRGGFR